MGMENSAVSEISQIVPASADLIPAFAGIRGGKLVRKPMSIQGNPSLAMSTRSTRRRRTARPVITEHAIRNAFAWRRLAGRFPTRCPSGAECASDEIRGAATTGAALPAALIVPLVVTAQDPLTQQIHRQRDREQERADREDRFVLDRSGRRIP